MDKKKKRNGGDVMAVSMGTILNVKGETAKRILKDIEKPIVDKAYLQRCEEMSAKIKIISNKK